MAHRERQCGLVPFRGYQCRGQRLFPWVSSGHAAARARKLMLQDSADALRLRSQVPGCSIMPLMSAYFVLAVANVIPGIRKHFAALRCVPRNLLTLDCLSWCTCAHLAGLRLLPCRDEGQQGRDVYNTYASGLFVMIALTEVGKPCVARLQFLPATCSARPAGVLLLLQAFSLARTWTPQAVGSAAGGAAVRSVPGTMLFMVAGAAVCKLITQWIEEKGCVAGVMAC